MPIAQARHLKKVKSNLHTRIQKAIDEFIEQQDKDGKSVSYGEIIGTLEYVKIDVIDRSYDSE